MHASAPCVRRPDIAAEHGAALLVALMATLLLTALGSGLVLLTTAETAISANYRLGQETLYAADAGIERAAQDLVGVPQWNDVLTGRVRSTFTDATTSPTLPDGSRVDLMAETAALQRTTDAGNRWGPNNPTWQLYAYGAIDDLLPGAIVDSGSYVAIWASDDTAENDGDPQRDGNGRLTLRAEAFGPFNTRRIVEATVSRSSPGLDRRGLTGQRGQGARNRHARDGSVGEPGTTLSRSEMNVGTGRMVQP